MKLYFMVLSFFLQKINSSLGGIRSDCGMLFLGGLFVDEFEFWLQARLQLVVNQTIKELAGSSMENKRFHINIRGWQRCSHRRPSCVVAPLSQIKISWQPVTAYFSEFNKFQAILSLIVQKRSESIWNLLGAWHGWSITEGWISLQRRPLHVASKIQKPHRLWRFWHGFSDRW